MVLFWLARWRGRDLLDEPLVPAVRGRRRPARGLALEAGWVATEVGRQPWVVYGVLRTSEAAGDNPGPVVAARRRPCVLYAAMTVGAVVVLRSMARRWRAGEDDLPSPYGPEAPSAPSAAAGAR